MGELEADPSVSAGYIPLHLCGTGLALAALKEAGLPLSDPCLVQGATWLRSRQNADGGWGETGESYDQPTRRGLGPSMASHTA